MNTFINELEALVLLAKQGIQTLEKYVTKSVKYELKDDGSIISEADIRINENIIKLAQEYFPGVPVHSEETPKTKWQSEKEIIIVDPLDGTTNFVNKIPISSVTIAFVQNMTPKVGVVAPLAGGIYYGIDGHGSFYAERIQSWENGSRLKCSNRKLKNSILNITADHNDEQSRKKWWEWISLLKPPLCYRIRIIESAAIELCWLASGKIDGYLHPSDKPWDIAAGGLIAKESGIILFNPDLSEWGLSTYGIIAITPDVEHDLVSILRSHIT